MFTPPKFTQWAQLRPISNISSHDICFVSSPICPSMRPQFIKCSSSSYFSPRIMCPKWAVVRSLTHFNSSRSESILFGISELDMRSARGIFKILQSRYTSKASSQLIVLIFNVYGARPSAPTAPSRTKNDKVFQNSVSDVVALLLDVAVLLKEQSWQNFLHILPAHSKWKLVEFFLPFGKLREMLYELHKGFNRTHLYDNVVTALRWNGFDHETEGRKL